MGTVVRFFDRQRVQKNLLEYPVYSPPFRYGLDESCGKRRKIPSPDQIRENYEIYIRNEWLRSAMHLWNARWSLRWALLDAGPSIHVLQRLSRALEVRHLPAPSVG